MRCRNIFSGKVVAQEAKSATTKVRAGSVDLVVQGKHQGLIKFTIRPESIRLTNNLPNEPVDNKLQVKLIRSRDCGNYVQVTLKGPLDLIVHLSHADFADLAAKPQSELIAVLHPENIHVLPE
jgi:ABC-type Fe3+/spermidine/putrescine transport system ATPase subunit